MSKIITVPIDKINTTILMSIWYKEYMPLIGTEREIEGKRYIDLEEQDVNKENFNVGV